MFEKDLTVSLLIDYYGELLSDRKKSAVCAYYNEDLSLAEVADLLGISRQGAESLIKKAVTELKFYEEKLHLAENAERGS